MVMKKIGRITPALIIMIAVIIGLGCKPREPSPAAAPRPQAGGTAAADPNSAPGPAVKSPIRLGAILSVTGSQSSLGLPEKQTLEMLKTRINAEGGLLGRPLEIIIYDDEGDELKAVALAKRLLANDRVTAVIGPSTSGTSRAVIDTVSSAQVPMVSCALSYKIVTDERGQPRKWVFKTPASDSMAVERIYDYFHRHRVARVALMTVASEFGDSGRAELKRLAPNYNLQVVADERFGQDDADMIAQLTRIKATDAQAIVVWAVQKAPAIVARNKKTLGLTQLLVQSQGVASQKFIELCGDAADGQVLPAGRLMAADQLPDADPAKPALKKYKTEFEAKYGPVSVFGGHAHDALMLIALAITKAGTDEPARVRDALEEIKGFQGLDGVFNFSPADHNGLTKDAFIMLKIEDQQWKLITD
jgi:branched-chain amino acid transport system substrate-binding protein